MKRVFLEFQYNQVLTMLEAFLGLKTMTFGLTRYVFILDEVFINFELFA